MQSRIAHGGDVWPQPMRCVRGTNERRRRRLHELSCERLHVPADVQRGVHGVRDELLQSRIAHGGDVWPQPMRRVRCSYERRRRRLHELSRERVYVPADVQRGVHGVRDELMQRRNAHGGDLCRHVLRRERARQRR